MMMTAVLPFTGVERMNYETPPQGITLTGYIVRRMHKTRLLAEMADLVAESPAQALAQFGVYAAAAGTSYGPAMYQPRFDRPGAEVTETDPETGAVVTVHQGKREPHYAFTYEVRLPDGSRIAGEEKILGTTVGLRGLGMPAPSQFEYQHAQDGYRAAANGVINSELAPGLGRWRVRGYADLQLEDNRGNRGSISLDRKGRIEIEITSEDGAHFSTSMDLS